MLLFYIILLNIREINSTMETGVNLTVDATTTESSDRKTRIKHLMDLGLHIENQLPEQTTDVTLDAVRSIILDSNDIIAEGKVHDRTEHTCEVVMDAQLMKMNHGLLSKVLLQGNTFSQRMYHNALLRRVQKPNGIDWTEITNIACGVARIASVTFPMLGAIEGELTTTKIYNQRQQRKKSTMTTEKQPESIARLERKDIGAQKVELVLEQFSNILKKQECHTIPFFMLVIDPNSLMQTVENGLQLSFLLKDNMISMEQGNDGLPHVRLLSVTERNVSAKRPKQKICTINSDLWKKMIDFYNIKEPLMHLTYDQLSSNGQSCSPDTTCINCKPKVQY